MKTNLSNKIERLENELTAFKKLREIELSILKKFDFEKFKNDLKPLKLYIDNQIYPQLNANNSVVIHLTLKPLEGCTIKKLNYIGFDSRGNYKNSKQLTEKTNKLMLKLKESTGVYVYVNQYSLLNENNQPSLEILATITYN